MGLYRLKPATKSAIWGGRKLMENYDKDFDGDNLAETWELSAHPDGPCVIDSGKDAGLTLPEFVEKYGASTVLGKNCGRFEDFPILIKLIDAKDNLSVQVHPDDAYARKHENQYGKTEMWYVVDAEPGAKLCFGCREDYSKDDFRKQAEEGTLEELLNFVPVKPGDVFFIEAGTIHAIGGGILIAEIQQNSNVTYRLYDYGRVGADGQPRELHLDKALDVAKLEPPKECHDFGDHIGMCHCFVTDLVDVGEDGYESFASEDSFVCLLVVDGKATVRSEEKSFQASAGDCFLVTAGHAFSMMGSAKVIRVFIPGE